MELIEVELAVPEGFQLIIGQSHFIKSVEDIYETISSSVPGIRFGLAFSEASGKALVRFDGTDPESVSMARTFASKIGAGHSFVVILHGAFPINVMNRLKSVEEVAGIFCATANAVSVVVAKTKTGRAILGVADGVSPKGEETPEDKEERRAFLRKVGYKR